MIHIYGKRGNNKRKTPEKLQAAAKKSLQSYRKKEDESMAGRSRIRTDLALEATERFQAENVEVRGVEIRERYDEEKDVRTTVVDHNGKRSQDHGKTTGDLYYH